MMVTSGKSLSEFLTEAVYLSVDPYMRVYALRYPLGTTMIGIQVGKIIESKAKGYPVGKYVCGMAGWRSHTIIDTNKEPRKLGSPEYYLLPDFGDLPLSLALGMLGMTG